MMRYKEVITLSTNLHSYINGFHSSYAKIGFLVSFQCQDLIFLVHFFISPLFVCRKKKQRRKLSGNILRVVEFLMLSPKVSSFCFICFSSPVFNFYCRFSYLSMIFFVCVVLVSLYEQNDKPSSAIE